MNYRAVGNWPPVWTRIFDDSTFCLELHHLPQCFYGASIEYIGGLDLSHTL
jgi:hypothetical protein